MQRLCSCASMAESKGSDPRSPRAGIHPLLWRPEIGGRTHHVCRSNRAEVGKPQGETETEDGSGRHQQGAYVEKQRARTSKLCSPISRTIVQIVERNRRATTTLSPILYLFQISSSTLYQKLQQVLAEVAIPPVIETRALAWPKRHALWHSRRKVANGPSTGRQQGVLPHDRSRVSCLTRNHPASCSCFSLRLTGMCEIRSFIP